MIVISEKISGVVDSLEKAYLALKAFFFGSFINEINQSLIRFTGDLPV